MPKQLPITIAQAAVWLLRLAVNPVLSRSLQNDPVAFSAWYATVGGIFDWPDEGRPNPGTGARETPLAGANDETAT
jgi:hypothetical protein